MTESTPIVAFDQHAASVVAAVLLPGQRTAAVHALAADLPTIRRFSSGSAVRTCGAATRPGRADSRCSGIWRLPASRVTSSLRR